MTAPAMNEYEALHLELAEMRAYQRETRERVSRIMRQEKRQAGLSSHTIKHKRVIQ